ncbi:hypothetical protein A2U01_0096675, partial [Trifolium medium]|nr:hypothetical protein [Trifolium medium]
VLPFPHSDRFLQNVDPALGGVTADASHPHHPLSRSHDCNLLQSFAGLTDWICVSLLEMCFIGTNAVLF